MFTGIVTDIGRVKSVELLEKGRRLCIETAWDLSDLAIGASVAHAGVCLTVTEIGKSHYFAEAWEEALRLTTLGALEAGTQVNLERALRIGDELGGHLVSGHIDGMAKILARIEEGGATRFEIEAPDELAPFIASKGSVCLDGTSLTVNGVAGNRFDVLLIRHTLEVTTWSERHSGDRLNLEIDQMARYAARLAEFH
jgi:riboflavin synthase